MFRFPLPFTSRPAASTDHAPPAKPPTRGPERVRLHTPVPGLQAKMDSGTRPPGHAPMAPRNRGMLANLGHMLHPQHKIHPSAAPGGPLGQAHGLQTEPPDLASWQRQAEANAPQVSSGVNYRDSGIDGRPQTVRDAAAAIRRAETHLQPELKIQYLAATSLPSALGDLAQLKQLSVSITECETLPESMGRLAQLQSLSLAANPRLQELPTSLTQLAHLKELTVHSTPLRTVPADIGKLSHLETLTLNGGHFQSLPDSLTRLSALKSLTINSSRPDGSGGTGLQALPRNLGQLKSLQQLSLKDHKELSQLPASLTQLNRLQSLDLSDCRKLTHLPQGMGQLHGLQELRLKNCQQLQSLPADLAQLRNLKTLDLSGCSNLHAAPEVLRQLPAGCTVLLPKHLERERHASPQRPGARPVQRPAALASHLNTAALSTWKQQMAPFQSDERAPRFGRWMASVYQSRAPQALPAAEHRILEQIVQVASTSAGFRDQLFDLTAARLKYTTRQIEHDLRSGGPTRATAALARRSLHDVQDLLLEHLLADPQKMSASDAHKLLSSTLQERLGGQNPAQFAATLAGVSGFVPGKTWGALNAYVQTHDPEGSRIDAAATDKFEKLQERANRGEISEQQMRTAMEAIPARRARLLQKRSHAVALAMLKVPLPSPPPSTPPPPAYAPR